VKTIRPVILFILLLIPSFSFAQTHHVGTYVSPGLQFGFCFSGGWFLGLQVTAGNTYDILFGEEEYVESDKANFIDAEGVTLGHRWYFRSKLKSMTYLDYQVSTQNYIAGGGMGVAIIRSKANQNNPELAGRVKGWAGSLGLLTSDLTLMKKSANLNMGLMAVAPIPN